MLQPVAPLPPEGPAFAAPWQAQAFAIVVLLAERGVFSWPEWVQAFAAEEAAGADDYYARWISAAEQPVWPPSAVLARIAIAARTTGAGSGSPIPK